MTEQITRVMLVDDDPDDLDFTREAFERSGLSFECVTFTTGHGAMNYLSRCAFPSSGEPLLPHLIISDLRVPDGDGQELLKFVKSDNRLSHIPMVIMSSAHHPSMEADCANAGVSGFFIKPSTMDEYDEWLHCIIPCFMFS